MKRTSFLFFLAVTMSFSVFELQASRTVSPYVDRLGVDILDNLNIKPDLASQTTRLFGDKFDPAMGGISFTHTDINIPGNSNLPMQVVRVLSGPDNWFSDSREFASWSLHIPHIRSSFVSEKGKTPETSGYPSDRRTNGWLIGKACSASLGGNSFSIRIGKKISYVRQQDYWGGDTISIPGKQPQKILVDSNSNKVTENDYSISCYNSPNGHEGFKVVDDSGVTYYFDVEKRVKSIKRLEFYPSAPTQNCSFLPGGTPCMPPELDTDDSFAVPVDKYSIFMLVSRVEDQYGNWVKYTYNSEKVSIIEANDGRKINFSYNSLGYISSASYAGKTYHYSYDTNGITTLEKVTRPDSKAWIFKHEKRRNQPGSNFWDPLYMGEHTQFPMTSSCPVGYSGPFIEMIHPDGMKGTFILSETYHGRTEVPKVPRPNPHGWPQYMVGYYTPKCSSMFSLTHKTLTELDGNVLGWSYQYSSNLGAFEGEPKNPIKNLSSSNFSSVDLGDLKSTKIYSPDGSIQEMYFSRRFDWSEQSLLFETTSNKNNQLISRLEKSILKGKYRGSSRISEDNTSSQKVLTKILLNTLYDTNGLSTDYADETLIFNSYELPEINKSYNSESNKTIYFKNLYHHNTAINLLNVPAGVMVSHDGVNWKEANRQEFYTSGNGIGQVYRSWIAGKHISTNTYHTDGNLLQTSYNGSNRYEKFENYYRGKARKITLPCTTTNGCTTVNGSTANTMVALLEVNADGTTKSVTDFNGNKVSYSYNPIGWLTKIDYADPKWADKVISYATVTTANDGISGSAIAAGSLRQSISQGNYEKRVYHDALLRPVFTRERDIANGATTRYQAFEYDHENRQTLASFPSSNAASRVGMATEYDALGRIVTQTRTSDNSSSSRDYLAGNKVAVTDSEGNTTTTTYLAYGQPTYDKPLLIEAPNTDDISLDYNEFAQVTSIRQGNITEKRLYDNYQQLCKSVRPETGITAYGYNAQRQQIWRALGTNGSSTSCDAASVPASHKTLLGYDNLGQLRTENFPDTTPDRTYSYDANGNLKALTAGNISWSYLYNSQNAIDKETLSLDGKSFVLDWEYNNLGAVSSLKYPSGALVDFAPNALGQATKAGNYVTGVSYHPNGQVKHFTFGNGIVRNVEMDTSGRIDLLTDSKSGVIKNKLDPSYDGNDNLVRLIDWVDRNNDIDNLVYDGVDRLLSADGRWGTGRYTYDGMGNILSRTLNNVNIGYSYNNLNQLSKLSGAYAYGYQYDTRGNVIHNGRYPLSYNLGQQMVSAKGINYSYDGHNRRVKQVKSDGSHYTVYSQSGQLLYRQGADSTKTESVYLGKQLVAEVDKR